MSDLLLTAIAGSYVVLSLINAVVVFIFSDHLKWYVRVFAVIGIAVVWPIVLLYILTSPKPYEEL